MRRLGAGAGAFLLVWSMAFVSHAAEPEIISIAYCTDCVPFHFRNKAGQADGMIIDLWRRWSEKTGTKIEFRAVPWAETLRMVGIGKADAHAGLFFSRQRAEFLEYGASLTETETHYFHAKNIPPISAATGLAPAARVEENTDA